MRDGEIRLSFFMLEKFIFREYIIDINMEGQK